MHDFLRFRVLDNITWLLKATTSKSLLFLSANTTEEEQSTLSEKRLQL